MRISYYRKLYEVGKCMENMGAYVQLDDSILDRIKHVELPEKVEDFTTKDTDISEAQKLIGRMETRELYTMASHRELGDSLSKEALINLVRHRQMKAQYFESVHKKLHTRT